MKYSLYKHASHIWVNTKEEASAMLFVLSHFTLQHSTPPSAGRTKKIIETLGQNIRDKTETETSLNTNQAH